ncbi:hypothetical protein AB1Y20_007773 [Prymnesium parvum]|uniref:Cyclic nucleotide-binding domain-containing protein n=1 Tax=Prymnesium parvum TaxID=97485 RepID=A0AB34ITQ6_PRYPA
MLVPSHRCTPSRTRTDTVSSSEAEGPSRCSSRRRPTSDFALDAEAEPRRRPTPERGELSSLTARVQMGAAQSRKPRGGLRRWKPPPFTAHLQKPSLLSHFLRTSEARDAFAKLLVRIDFKKGEQLPDAAVLYLESGELVRQRELVGALALPVGFCRGKATPQARRHLSPALPCLAPRYYLLSPPLLALPYLTPPPPLLTPPPPLLTPPPPLSSRHLLPFLTPPPPLSSRHLLPFLTPPPPLLTPPPPLSSRHLLPFLTPPPPLSSRHLLPFLTPPPPLPHATSSPVLTPPPPLPHATSSPVLTPPPPLPHATSSPVLTLRHLLPVLRHLLPFLTPPPPLLTPPPPLSSRHLLPSATSSCSHLLPCPPPPPPLTPPPPLLTPPPPLSSRHLLPFLTPPPPLSSRHLLPFLHAISSPFLTPPPPLPHATSSPFSATSSLSSRHLLPFLTPPPPSSPAHATSSLSSRHLLLSSRHLFPFLRHLLPSSRHLFPFLTPPPPFPPRHLFPCLTPPPPLPPPPPPSSRHLLPFLTPPPPLSSRHLFPFLTPPPPLSSRHLFPFLTPPPPLSSRHLLPFPHATSSLSSRHLLPCLATSSPSSRHFLPFPHATSSLSSRHLPFLTPPPPLPHATSSPSSRHLPFLTPPASCHLLPCPHATSSPASRHLLPCPHATFSAAPRPAHATSSPPHPSTRLPHPTHPTLTPSLRKHGLRKILKLASSVYGGSATDSSARKEPSFDGASPDASAPSRRQPSRARTSQREGSGRREMTRRNSVSRFLSRGAKREPGPAMELTVLLAITDGLAYYLPNRALIKYVSHSQESFLAIKSFVHLRNFFGELSCLSQPPSTSACQAVCDYCRRAARRAACASRRSSAARGSLRLAASMPSPSARLSTTPASGASTSTSCSRAARSFVDGVEGKSSHVLIRPGQYFGAEPLMLDWRYTGSAVVSSDAIVAIVRRRHLADIWTVLPQLKSAMEAQLKIQILEGYRMAKLPYFALLSDAQLKQAANACEIDLNVPPNKLVIQKGSKLDALHIVVDGEVGAIGRHASSTNNSSCDLRAQVSASSVLGASTRESEDGYITPSRLPQPLEKKLTLRNRLSFNEVQRHSCDHEGGKRTSRKTSVESSLSMMRGLSSGILFGSKMTGRRSSKKTFSETDDSKREIAERAEALSYQLGNVHWKVQPGEWLGELAVLFDDCCKAAATYTVEETGCVMLRFPRDAFITLFDDDRSIISELRVKLLRADCGLEDILGSPRAQPVFFAFLEEQSRGLSYGLKFYEAAHKYAKLEQLSFPAAKRVVSQSIRFEFFDLRSPHACRIPAERLELIDQAMALGNPVAELFLVEARAWFSVFREEYLPRFVNDPLFWSLLEEIGSYKADLVNVALFIQETVSTVSVSRHTSEDTSRNAGRSGDQPGSSDPILDERMMKRLTIDSKGVGRVSLLSA